MKKKFVTFCLVMTMVLVVSGVARADFYNGFETDTSGWFNTNRVASGTAGITSAGGSYHATTNYTSTYTNWGGYNFGAGGGVPTSFLEYSTSIDIYLDLGGGWVNDTRFDFSSAINGADGNHKRDFIFNAGFYNSGDLVGPGAGTDRFVISASNNSQPGSAYAKNPDKNPIAIGSTGWYTFQHHFYDNSGVLAADMSIYDSSNSLVNSWILSDASDLISGIGGNRYGWFACNDFDILAFDNTSMTVVPVPAAVILGVLGMGVAGLKLRKYT